MPLVKEAKEVFTQDCHIRYRDHYNEIFYWGREIEVISEDSMGKQEFLAWEPGSVDEKLLTGNIRNSGGPG